MEFTNTITGMRKDDAIEIRISPFNPLIQATSDERTDIALKIGIGERCCLSGISHDPYGKSGGCKENFLWDIRAEISYYLPALGLPSIGPLFRLP